MAPGLTSEPAACPAFVLSGVRPRSGVLPSHEALPFPLLFCVCVFF